MMDMIYDDKYSIQQPKNDAMIRVEVETQGNGNI